jgi:transposase InsO family protein
MARVNGTFAELLVHALGRECLDWTLVLGRRHLEETLTEYIRHYNEHRPHRGLGLEAPVPGHTTVAAPLAIIARRNVLGGLIHEYHQLAA